jgi:PAS domain S-box-containing protein
MTSPRDESADERRFRLVVEAAPNAVVMIDRAGKIVMVNTQAERIFGYSRAELVGQPVEMLVPERFRSHHSELRETFFADPRLRPVGTGRDLYGLKRDGGEFPVEIGLTPIETDAGTMVFSAIIDITARKAAELALRETEQRFSLLVEGVTDYAIYMLDPNGIVTSWNRGAQRIKGYRTEEIVGQHFACFYTEEDRKANAPQQTLEIAARDGRFEAEALRVRKDGSRFLANVVIDALKDEGGQLIGFAKITRDVSERVAAARELERLNRELQKRATELEASNKELESFAYSVSHDLRAPLRHVAAYSELLQKQASSLLDDKSRRYVQTILESAKRMGNLIDDLLAFSRLGRAEAKMRAVDLQQVVKEAIAEVSRDTRDRDIAWKIGALPACHGDSSMLKLVVVNLVSNAVKFTRMRTRAEIEIGCVDKDNDELEVFVRDNGAGFDMQYANKLFGVFQRLHLAEQFEGTGIGLATVQRITHRHGGQVRAEGAVDQGATFYFSLPKAHDLAERTAGTS